MPLHQTFTHKGKIVHATYVDRDSFEGLPADAVRQHYGVCFDGGQIVLAQDADGSWSLLGGKPEPGESFEQTLRREILEEGNLEVMWHAPVGYQVTVTDGGPQKYQLRSVCTVRPLGPFVSDPGGSVKAIMRADPAVCNEIIGWGDIGDHVIARAVRLLKEHEERSISR